MITMMLRYKNSFWWRILFLACVQITMSWCDGWAWLGGAQIVDQTSTRQYPGGRSGASTWHDCNLNLTWVFGGKGFSDLPSGKPHLLDDLWLFNLNSTSQSKERLDFFVKIGPGAFTESPKQVVQPWPRSRHHASMCGFADTLILFGGLGKNGVGLDDLWILNLRAKTWRQLFKKGPSARGHPGLWCFGSFMFIFGGVDKGQILDDMWKFNLITLEWTLLQPLSVDMEFPGKAYLPVGRNGPATWISGEAFYMFGGNAAPSFSYSLQQVEGLVSDLWRYFPCNSTWDHVKGPVKTNHKKVHAHFRKHSDNNTPGPRIGAGSWLDSSGNLWLFGGAGHDTHPTTANEHSQVLSDIWRFNTKLKTWAFIGGPRESGKAGVYKSFGKETEDGLPGGRTEMMVFPGSSDKIYIFGGVGHGGRKVGGFLNDLWSVDVSSILSDQYGISAWSLLLFLGVCISLLMSGFIIGFSSRPDKDSSFINRRLLTKVRSGSGTSDHQYQRLQTGSDF